MREAQMIADEILAERRRQIEVEGFTRYGDDIYRNGELLRAAHCYINAAYRRAIGVTVNESSPTLWPWPGWWWKPKNSRRDLIRAAALIVAEIERLDREAASEAGDGFNPAGSGPQPVGPRPTSEGGEDAITPNDIQNLSAAQAANALQDY